MTSEQNKLANFIINEVYKSDGGRPRSGHDLGQLLQEKYDKADIIYVTWKLKSKGLLDVPIEGSEDYFLTDKGWAYENYDKQLEYEEYNRGLERRQMQSVIDTNKSVEATNTFQKVALVLTTLFALITAFFSVWEAIKDENVNVTVPAPTVIVQKENRTHNDSTQTS